MRKLIYGVVMFFCGFLGLLMLLGISVLYPHSFEFTTTVFFGFLVDSHTVIPFVIFCLLFVRGWIIASNAVYEEEKNNRVS